jgi:hypothetical protein
MLRRLFQRLSVLGLGVISVWLIVFVIFRIADNRLPFILALSATYGIAAYVVLPRVVRMGLKVLHRKHVPAFTTTGDGFPGDPVNIVLIGTLQQLRNAFAASSWCEADKLGLASSLRMIRSFVLNAPYPTAPFSTLYLFGRAQDIGFQKAIDNSPRKRHHIRFWAMGMERAEDTLGTSAFWMNTDRPPEDLPALWIGAGTRDTGISFTRMTFQFTHATDSDVNVERDFIITELKKSAVIANIRSHLAGEEVPVGKVNHYVTDGDIAVAELTKP